MKGLTSHVLDTLRGQPAAGVRIELWQNADTSAKKIADVYADEVGRCILATELTIGCYEIRFHIGPYFAKTCSMGSLPEPAFLDVVSVRFSVADALRHYHIPLVASPWSYTTYKGGAPADAHEGER